MRPASGPGTLESMTLQLDHPEMDSAVHGLRADADRIRHALDRAARRVDETLDCWSGVAAASYAEAWTDWRDGARRVLAALEATTDLLETTRVDLVERDLDSRTDSCALRRRLG